MTMRLQKKCNNFVVVTDNEMLFGTVTRLKTGIINVQKKFHFKIAKNS